MRELLGDRVTDVAADAEDGHASTSSPTARSSATTSRRSTARPSPSTSRSPTSPERAAALDRELADLGDRFDEGGGTMRWEYLLLTARRA